MGKSLIRSGIVRIIAIASLLFSGAGIGCHAQVNAEQVTAIGRNVLSLDDYMLAIYYFNQAIKAKPYLSDPYFFRALAKMKLDDFKGAEADCSLAIERNRFKTEAYKLRGFTRQQMGLDSLALLDYEVGLQYDPTDREFLFYKAIAETDLEQWSAADSTFSVLISANPNFYEGITARAHLRMQKGDTIAALDDISRSLSISKSQINPYLMRADIYSSQEKWPEAIEAVDEVIRLMPDNPDMYINRAFLKYRNDDYFGAMADYNDAIHIDPYNSAALFNRGLLRFEVRELDKAAEDFSRVLDLDGNNFHARYNRALVYLTANDYAKAEPDIKAIIERYPRFYPAYYALAQCRQERGDTRGAIKNMMIADDIVRRYVENPEKNPLDRPTVAQVANNKGMAADNESEEEVMDRFNQLITKSSSTENSMSLNDKYKGRVQDRETSLAPEPMFSLSMTAPEQSLKSISNYFRELGDLNSHNYISEKIFLTEEHKPMAPEEIEKTFSLAEKYSASLAGSKKRAVDYLGRGIVYTMLRNYESAVADFDKALELMPDFTVALMGKGYALAQLSVVDKDVKPMAVIDVFDKALALNPMLVYAWFNKGNIYYDAGDYIKAWECYNKAIELYPELGQAYYNRGLCKMQAGKKQDAFDDFSKAGEQGVLQGYRVMKSFQ